MTTVSIDCSDMDQVISKLGTLAGNIESAQLSAQNACRQPPYSSSPIHELTGIAQWMRDEVPGLQARVDLARALKRDGDFDGTVQYTVNGADTGYAAKAQLGQEMAEMGEEIAGTDANDEIDPDLLAQLVNEWQFDETVTSSMYESLGADGTIDLIDSLGSHIINRVGDDREPLDAQLLRDLQTSLETASEAPTFDAEEFGRQLAEAGATLGPLGPDERGVSHASTALSFLLHDGNYGTDFLNGVGDALDQFERVDMEGRAGLWSGRALGGNFLTMMFDEESQRAAFDPMTSFMTALGNNGEASLDFFADNEDRQKYYIQDRNWSNDEWSAIADALDAATTSSDNIGDPGSGRQEDAAALTAAMVDYLGNRSEDAGFGPGKLSGDAAESFAHIITTYMPAVDNAITRDLPSGDQTLGGDNLVDLSNPPFGGLVNMPVFESSELADVVQAVTANDDGFAALRSGVSSYQAATLDHGIEGLEEGNQELWDAAVTSDARVEGWFVKQVGDENIAEGAEADARRQAWVELGKDLTGVIPVPGGQIVSGLSSAAISITAREVSGAVDGARDQAVTDAQELARLSQVERENAIIEALADSEIVTRSEVTGLESVRENAEARGMTVEQYTADWFVGDTPRPLDQIPEDQRATYRDALLNASDNPGPFDVDEYDDRYTREFVNKFE